MFAGIDIASERHVLARLDSAGKPIGSAIAFTEDHAGYTRLAEVLAPPPVLVAMEATGHYWKNLFAVLTAAGHEVALLNPFTARRFQDASLERTKTDTIDAGGLARLAFEKRPAPTQLHDAAAESLRELVRHRDQLRQDFDDRVRQLHRLVDLGFPEFTRHVRSFDSMLATALIAEYPTAQAFARATPRRLAKLRYDGCHFVGPDLAERLVAAAKHSVGQHHGPVYARQARHICQDLDLWRRRLTEIDRDIEGLLETHEVGKLPLSIDGLGPHSVARIIAAVGDPARFRSAGAFAAYVGVVPGLRQSGKVKVEGLVGLSRRNFMAPIPRFATLDAFNAHLEEQWRKRQADVLRGQSETIGERLARDLAAMSELPAAPFDACDQATTGRASSQALVRYKTYDYSVPAACGHRDVRKVSWRAAIGSRPSANRPRPEGEIGGDDHGGALVEPADQVKEQLPAGLGEGQVAELVEHDEVEAGEMIGDASLAAGAGSKVYV